MPTPSAQRLSQTEYLTDGVTTVWNFSFSGGYILDSHVKAYSEVIATGLRTEIVVTAPMLVGPFQIQITPAIAIGSKLVIYRDTPKDLPLVDFIDESGFSEVSLDTNAKQAIFVAAETQDLVNTSSSYDAEQAASQAAASASAADASADAAAVSAADALGYANTAVSTPVAGPTAAAAVKTTPVDADLLPLADSAASFSLKQLSWANVKAALSTLFAARGTNSDITSTTGLATLTNVSTINAHPVGKSVAQVVVGSTGALATGTTILPLDNTVPQQTEGDQYLTVSITPTNASSSLEIEVNINLSHSVANTGMSVALFKDSGASAIAAAWGLNAVSGGLMSISFKHIIAAGSTSAQVFKVRAGSSSAGTTTLNGQLGGALLGGVLISRIIATEVLP